MTERDLHLLHKHAFDKLGFSDEERIKTIAAESEKSKLRLSSDLHKGILEKYGKDAEPNLHPHYLISPERAKMLLSELAEARKNEGNITEGNATATTGETSGGADRSNDSGAKEETEGKVSSGGEPAPKKDDLKQIKTRSRLMPSHEVVIDDLGNPTGQAIPLRPDSPYHLTLDKERFENSYTEEEKDRLLAQYKAVRLKQDAYGVCVTYRHAISKRRLSAVPWTRVCRDCKEKQGTDKSV